MKAIIILGAGIGQCSLIRWAKEHGFFAVVVSPKGEYPGFSLADRCLYYDINAVDEIISDSGLIGLDVVSVVSSQLDQAVVPAAKLATYFGVPGIGVDVALRFTNKYEMRRYAEECGITVPKCVHVINFSELEVAIKSLRFPVMIKPVDNAASRGVYKADSLLELKRVFPLSASESNQGVIIEEFIQGKEYVVEAFTCDGKVTNLIVGHRDYFNIPKTFIPSATIFKDADSAVDLVELRLKEVNERLIRGFGLQFGITHGEFIYDSQQDEVYLVEIAARGGGVGIASDLIAAACGVDADDVYMRASIGEHVTLSPLFKGAAAYFCFMLPGGVITGISGIEDVRKIPGVIRAEFSNVKIGMKVSPARDKYSRKGPILVKAADKLGCYAIYEKIRESLQICTEGDSFSGGIIWS